MALSKLPFVSLAAEFRGKRLPGDLIYVTQSTIAMRKVKAAKVIAEVKKKSKATHLLLKANLVVKELYESSFWVQRPLIWMICD